jgi:hypothetical protein
VDWAIGRSFGKYKRGGSFHLLKFRIPGSRLDRLNSPQPARLTGARYAQFIGTELPDLLEIVPLAYGINDWFQHFSRNVREILNNQYPQRWIGRGPHHWPARSPDLNHLSAAHKFRG